MGVGSKGCLSYSDMLWPVTLTKYQKTAAVWVSFRGELAEDGVYVSSMLSLPKPAKDLMCTPYTS
jgi:hypothetical protein